VTVPRRRPVRLVRPSQIEDAASDPDAGAWTYAELKGRKVENTYHEHVDKQGIVHRCYHSCRNLLTNWQFWAGLTLGFPVEHLLWEKLWPFYLVTQWFGL